MPSGNTRLDLAPNTITTSIVIKYMQESDPKCLPYCIANVMDYLNLNQECKDMKDWSQILDNTDGTNAIITLVKYING